MAIPIIDYVSPASPGDRLIKAEKLGTIAIVLAVVQFADFVAAIAVKSAFGNRYGEIFAPVLFGSFFLLWLAGIICGTWSVLLHHKSRRAWTGFLINLAIAAGLLGLLLVAWYGISHMET